MNGLPPGSEEVSMFRVVLLFELWADVGDPLPGIFANPESFSDPLHRETFPDSLKSGVFPGFPSDRSYFPPKLLLSS